MASIATERSSDFYASLQPAEIGRLRPMSESAWRSFLEAGIPAPKNEEYKYLSFREMVSKHFGAPTAFDCTESDLQNFGLADTDGPRLVFVNGRWNERLSHLDAEPGVIVQPFSLAPGFDFEDIGSLAKVGKNPFVDLNTAHLDDGAFVSVNGTAAQPIHLIFVCVGDGHSHPRVWIELAPGARAAVIESHAGAGASFVNSVSEIHLNQDSALEHIRIQTRSETVFDFGWTEVWQESGSDLRSTNTAFGGRLARTDLNVFLNGENCHCLMNGAYFAAGEQVIDNHTRLDHAKPNCNSFELYKGILAGRSTGVFNGKIFVHQDAQKTDAKQTNQALLLSKQATVNTKPQLEILADDVKCTHGATVGQLREDAMFYLRARGIPEKQAKAILVQAFVGEVFENVRCESVRESLQNMLMNKFERNASSIEEM